MRELRNVVEQTVLLSREREIEVEDLGLTLVPVDGPAIDALVASVTTTAWPAITFALAVILLVTGLWTDFTVWLRVQVPGFETVL